MAMELGQYRFKGYLEGVIDEVRLLLGSQGEGTRAGGEDNSS